MQTRDTPQGGHGERVLIVDDQETVLLLVHQALEQDGYNVTVAGDPLEALAIAEHEPEYNLLLTDVAMPTLNGAELATRLSSRAPQMKIILMSGNATGPHTTYPGRASFLQKPFTIAELTAKVRKTLDSDSA